jgi:O-antigen ligase
MQIAQQTVTKVLIIAFLLIAAFIQANLIMTSAYIAVILSLAALFFMVFINAPVGLLLILIFFFPFSGTGAFKTAMAAIPGFKPLQILSVAVFVVALLNAHNAARLPRAAMLFFGVIIACFTIAILRSIPNLANINALMTENVDLPRYFLSQYFKPLIYFIPALIVVQYVHSTKDIDRVVLTINWSITILSLVIIAFFMLNPNLILDPKSTRTYYADSFGLHTNSIVNYYILGFPFVLTDIFRHKMLQGIVKSLLCAVAIALLFSRSAYFIFIFSILIYLFISRRAKWLPIAMAALMLILLMLPASITERATKGFYSKDRNEISAGRVDDLWLPMIREISDKPGKLFFGNGRYAMVSSEAHKKGLVLQAMHPHNMYLEMVLDSGLMGLIVFLSLFAFLLKKVYSSISTASKSTYKEYQIAVMTSLLCFLLSGLTDRTFFPDEINGYLWISAAMAFVMERHLEQIRSFEKNVVLETKEDTA